MAWGEPRRGVGVLTHLPDVGLSLLLSVINMIALSLQNVRLMARDRW